MNRINTFLWYLQNIGFYVHQMVPCMILTGSLFILVCPLRQKRLNRLGLSSGFIRETALLVFVLFMSGLAALTLFPNNFWSHFMDCLVSNERFDWRSFYPSGEYILSRLKHIRDLYRPFEEIKRAFRAGPWFMFLLQGNIGIFLPVGFFVSLLWRKPSWWRAILVGLFCSCGIEFVQIFALRRTDVDDILLNTMGALLGHILYRVFRAAFPAAALKFQCRPMRRDSNG